MDQIAIEDAQSFGQAVRAARKESGLSQMQLAERCGCSQRFVSEVERGKPTAELGRALRLLVELDIPVVAGGGKTIIDGRAEVHYAIVRIAEALDASPQPRKKLSEFLGDERHGR